METYNFINTSQDGIPNIHISDFSCCIATNYCIINYRKKIAPNK